MLVSSITTPPLLPSARERKRCDLFHRDMVALTAREVLSNLSLFNLAPKRYQTYFPFTLLWKFTKLRARNEQEVIAILEKEIGLGFMEKEELPFFTRFVHEDYLQWGFIFSALFYRVHYAKIPPQMGHVLEQVLNHDFFVTGDYLSFIARHIRCGVLLPGAGSGPERLSSWLEGLAAKIRDPKMYHKILLTFPFSEHPDVCEHMLAHTPPLRDKALLRLVCLKAVFNPDREEHWSYLEQLGFLWLETPFDGFLPFVCDVYEQCQNPKALDIFLGILKEWTLAGLKSASKEVSAFLHYNPFGQRPLELSLRKDICAWIKKMEDHCDPIFLKNIYLKLVPYADFPYFWRAFPLSPLHPIDFHELLLEVEMSWPQLSLSPAQQEAHGYYLAFNLNPSASQRVRNAHFFPSLAPILEAGIVEALFLKKSSLLSLYRLAHSSPEHWDEIMKQRPLLFSFSISNWHDIMGLLKLVLLLPPTSQFSVEQIKGFGRSLQLAFRELMKWNKTSPRLAYELVLCLHETATRFPQLFSLVKINLTPAFEAAFDYVGDEPDERLQILEAAAHLLSLPMEMNPPYYALSARLSRLAQTSWRGKSSMRAARCFIIFQRTLRLFNFHPPQLSKLFTKN